LNVFFDLDGTLTDSAVGITRCFAHALERLGQVPPAAEDLRAHIGSSLAGAFGSLLGSSDEVRVCEAIALYRERFVARGIYENEVYAGIPESLERLRDRGLRLWVVTSKPAVFAEQIVRHFDLARFFVGIHGAELDGTRSSKGELVAHALRAEGIAPDLASMVGDLSYDVHGAHENQVRAVAVLWGYGTREELTAARAQTLVQSPADLVAALSGP
jgi:phosphoglycolate phosphatase